MVNRTNFFEHTKLIQQERKEKKGREGKGSEEGRKERRKEGRKELAWHR